MRMHTTDVCTLSKSSVDVLRGGDAGGDGGRVDFGGERAGRG